MKEEITFSPEYIEQLVRIIARYSISNDNAEKWFKLPKGLVSGWKHEFYQDRKPEALCPETWLLSDARCNTLYGDLSKRFRLQRVGQIAEIADPAFDASAIKILRIEDRVFQKKHWDKIIEHAGKFAHVERIDLLNAPDAEMENFWSAFPGVAEVNFHRMPPPKYPGRHIGLKSATLTCRRPVSQSLDGFFQSILPNLEELNLWFDDGIQKQEIAGLIALLEDQPFPMLKRLWFSGDTWYEWLVPPLGEAEFIKNLDAIRMYYFDRKVLKYWRTENLEKLVCVTGGFEVDKTSSDAFNSQERSQLAKMGVNILSLTDDFEKLNAYFRSDGFKITA